MPSCTAGVLVMAAGARLALVCVLIHLAAIRDTISSPAPAPQPTATIKSFVTRNGTQLEAGGKPYFFTGFNNYYLPTYAATPSERTTEVDAVIRYRPLR